MRGRELAQEPAALALEPRPRRAGRAAAVWARRAAPPARNPGRRLARRPERWELVRRAIRVPRERQMEPAQTRPAERTLRPALPPVQPTQITAPRHRPTRRPEVRTLAQRLRQPAAIWGLDRVPPPHRAAAPELRLRSRCKNRTISSATREPARAPVVLADEPAPLRPLRLMNQPLSGVPTWPWRSQPARSSLI